MLTESLATRLAGTGGDGDRGVPRGSSARSSTSAPVSTCAACRAFVWLDAKGLVGTHSRPPTRGRSSSSRAGDTRPPSAHLKLAPRRLARSPAVVSWHRRSRAQTAYRVPYADPDIVADRARLLDLVKAKAIVTAG